MDYNINYSNYDELSFLEKKIVETYQIYCNNKNLPCNGTVLFQIHNAWQCVHKTTIAQKGQELSKLLDHKNLLYKISNNVYVVDNALKIFFKKILRDSFLIADRAPFSFFKTYLPEIDFNCSGGIIFIDTFKNGDELYQSIKNIMRRKPRYLIGIGGGRTLDYLKFIGLKASVDTIAIPTSLTTHVYASPKIHALEPIKELGYHLTISGCPPTLAVIEKNLIWKAKEINPRLIFAGLGDISAFIVAVKDWELAVQNSRDQDNDFVRQWIKEIINKLYEIDYSIDFKKWWLDYIKMQVMLCNITDWVGSAPASGSEHLFAKCAEEEVATIPLHGELVALGTVIMSRVHRLNTRKIARLITKLGLPLSLKKIGLTKENVIQALLKSPREGRRKNRFTILEIIDCSQTYFSDLLEELISQKIISE